MVSCVTFLAAAEIHGQLPEYLRVIATASSIAAEITPNSNAHRPPIGDEHWHAPLGSGPWTGTKRLPANFQLNFNVCRFGLGALGPIKARFTVLNELDRCYALRDETGIGVGEPQYTPRRGYSLTVEKDF